MGCLCCGESKGYLKSDGLGEVGEQGGYVLKCNNQHDGLRIMQPFSGSYIYTKHS